MTRHCVDCSYTQCICDPPAFPVSQGMEPRTAKQLAEAFQFMQDCPSLLAAQTARAERAERGLREIVNLLGPTACKCEGLQAEVDMALEVARTILAENHVLDDPR